MANPGVVYLDNAAATQKPQAVIDAVTAGRDAGRPLESGPTPGVTDGPAATAHRPPAPAEHGRLLRQPSGFHWLEAIP
jgi:selenocysteine lyase/cysteine desulfurase